MDLYIPCSPENTVLFDVNPQTNFVLPEGNQIVYQLNQMAKLCKFRIANRFMNGSQFYEGLPAEDKYSFIANLHPENSIITHHDKEKKCSTGIIEFLVANKINCVLLGGIALDTYVKNLALNLVKRGPIMVVINIAATCATTEEAVKLAAEEMKNEQISFVEHWEEIKLGA